MSPASAKSPADLDQLCINTIRTLSMDAVQKANSGHPGTPMALAPVAFHLWQNHLRYDPEAPLWPNRDRFVLSVGHASMLLYSLLHLAGVKAVGEDGKPTGGPAVSLDDIKQFRQLDSKTPGHPEYRETTGVETTTGPLGQGLGNSVGMAMAARWHEAHFNQPGAALFGYRVYALCGDGDMMEGVSHEAASLAGHLRLSNLIWIYDSNRITIEGHTDLAYSDDVESRFRGYNWNTMHVDDANDEAALEAAINKAKATTDKPTLIVVKSIIAWGAPNKRPTASRSARKRSSSRSAPTAGRKTPSFSCRRACASISRRAWARAARRRARSGKSASPTTASSFPSLARSSRRCTRTRCPTTGTPTFPCSSQTKRASRRASRRARCSTRSRSAFRG
jgi:transketolase